MTPNTKFTTIQQCYQAKFRTSGIMKKKNIYLYYLFRINLEASYSVFISMHVVIYLFIGTVSLLLSSNVVVADMQQC